MIYPDNETQDGGYTAYLEACQTAARVMTADGGTDCPMIDGVRQEPVESNDKDTPE